MKPLIDEICREEKGIMRRGQFPFLFRYQAFAVKMKNRSDFIKLL
jgi:hypothetical protein